MAVSNILGAKGRDVITALPTATVHEVARKLAQHKIGAVVIIDEGHKLSGIVSERDIVRRVASDGPAALDRPVAEIMSRTVRTCKIGDSEQELMALMTAHRIRHLPVVDNGKLAGMISIGDVVKLRMENVEREAEELKSYIATAG
jgi:CBS domain-containing protein